jgi:hypothetical protein
MLLLVGVFDRVYRKNPRLIFASQKVGYLKNKSFKTNYNLFPTSVLSVYKKNESELNVIDFDDGT